MRNKKLSNQELLNQGQAVRYLGVTTPTFIKWIDRGLAPEPVMKLGRVKLYSQNSLDEFIKNHTKTRIVVGR
ncbi:hypothetical protein MCHI_000806 [Candidatus Magnetoovum chiemensis]|nr:hypothetical protein MCHI_000806 [Candidatus Magnetoovum chiemensis]